MEVIIAIVSICNKNKLVDQRYVGVFTNHKTAKDKCKIRITEIKQEYYDQLNITPEEVENELQIEYELFNCHDFHIDKS